MPQADGRDLSLVFLIDALGYEIVGRGGFLDGLVPPERPRIRSILGFSSAAIPTIFTGAMPERHGHWSMYRRNIGDSVFQPHARWLRLAGRLPRGQWQIRRWLSRRIRERGMRGYFALYDVPLHYLPLFDLIERENIYRPGAFPGVPSLFDHLERSRVPYRVWDFSHPEERALREMEEAARAGKEQLLLLYASGLDATMHIHGPRGGAVRTWLHAHEEKITAVVEAARRAGRRPRLRIFGDHGMAPVVSTIDVGARLEGLRSRMPRDYIVFLDSTMARFWFQSPSSREEVLSALSDVAGGRFIPAEELAALGVYFPDHSYGEEIFLCDPGVLICPSFMGRDALRGMHGYHPEDPDSFTTLLAEPAPAKVPDSILQIAPMLLEDLGIVTER